MKSKLFVSSLIVSLLSGCMSMPDSKMVNGKFDGLEDTTLGGTLEALSGQEKRHILDNYIFTGNHPDISASRGNGQIVAAAATGAIAPSLALGVAGGAVTLLGSSYKHFPYSNVIIVKADEQTNPVSKDMFLRVNQTVFWADYEQDFVVVSVDDDHAVLAKPNTNETVEYRFTKEITPELVKRINPVSYSGEGHYFAYSFSVSSALSNQRKMIPFDFSNRALFLYHDEWLSLDSKAKTATVITYLKDYATHLTIVRNHVFSTNMFNLDGSYSKYIDRIDPFKFDPAKTTYELR